MKEMMNAPIAKGANQPANKEPSSFVPSVHPSTTSVLGLRPGLLQLQHLQRLAGNRATVQLMNTSPKKNEVIQGVFVYSYISGSIMYNENSDEYYQGLGFKQVEGNGYKVWSDPRNADDVQYLLKKQSYQEQTENDPMNDSPLNATDANGVAKIARYVIETYPPSDYEYLLPGASGDLIGAALEVQGVHIHRISISDINYDKLKTMSDEERGQLFNYVGKSIPDVLHSDKSVLIVDALSTGASLRSIKSLIGSIDETQSRQREIVPLALNEIESIAEAQQVGDDSDLAKVKANGDKDMNYAKKRIYKQEYKKKLSRVLPKTPLGDILSGQVTDPEQIDHEAAEAQHTEVRAMFNALAEGQYQVKDSYIKTRALVSHANISFKDAEAYLDAKPEIEKVIAKTLGIESFEAGDFLAEHQTEIAKRVFGEKEKLEDVVTELGNGESSVSDSSQEIEMLKANAKYHDFDDSEEQIIAIIAKQLEDDLSNARNYFEENKVDIAFIWMMKENREEELIKLLNPDSDDEYDLDDGFV